MLTLATLAGLPGGAAAQPPSPYIVATHDTGRAARFDVGVGSVAQDSAPGGDYGQVVATPDGRRFYVVDQATRGSGCWARPG
jgi:hypothetical protein